MTNQPTEIPRGDEPQTVRRRKPAPPWIPGVAAFLLAIGSAIVQAVGIAQASASHWELGAQLAWVAIALSVVAIIVGLVAVILNRGRRWGVAAMVLGVVANPLVLVALFRLLG